MKQLLTSALLVLAIPSLNIAQCAYNNTAYLTGAAPTVIGNSIIAPQTWGGEYNRVTNMQAGSTYEITTCGSTTFDSELTIFPAGGGNSLAYDDDGCGIIGGSSKIMFTPPNTGDYDIQLNEYSCATNTIDMDMTITLVSGGGGGGGAAITIPVVVHVIYKNNNENISNAQIQSQIAVLNADYRKLNADFNQTPAVFQGVAADANIEFCLATVDPNGNPTDGITRTFTNTQSFSQGLEPKSTQNGGVENWNPQVYLNMWVCDLGGNLLGYATFPTDLAAEPELDGVVIDYEYFGNINTTAPFDKGRTATHEVGHWLNLRHVWGDNFCGDDFVNDTPTQQESNGGCPNFPHVTCNNGPDGDMFMNYMDYVNDACMFMFTNGQKTRMDATFANLRTQMATSGGCGATGIADPSKIPGFQMYPNPANSEVKVELPAEMLIDEIEILDMVGRIVVKENPAVSVATINIDALRAGTYIVKILSGGSVSQKKLMVQ